MKVSGVPGDMFDQVTIVCVTYQSRRVVESLAATVRAFPHVLIIDNASSDGTVAAVRQTITHARVIQRDHNGGFGTANNEAMAQVKTPLALMLNPDCDIKPEALQILVDVLARYPSAGIVAPQSWRANQTPQKCYRPAFYEPPLKTPYRLADGTCSAQWLNGCCLLTRVHAFREIGGFDENFFLFYEDDDLCLRMRKAGFECLLEPGASAWHTGGGSSAPGLRVSFIKPFHYVRSRHLAICKYRGRSAGRLYLTKLMLAAAPVALIYALLLRRKHFIKWVAWGCSAVSSALTPERTPDPQPAPEALKPHT